MTHFRTAALTAILSGLGGWHADASAAHPWSVANMQTALAFATQATATLPPSGEGRRLYLKLNCYGCHGMYAAGGMGPNIVHAESGDVSEAVLEGEDSGMRSFSSYVSTTDINNIAAYLQSIGTSSEPKFNDWWVPVPTK